MENVAWKSSNEHEKPVLRLLQPQKGDGKRWSRLRREWRRRGRIPGLDSLGPKKEEPEQRMRKRQRREERMAGNTVSS